MERNGIKVRWILLLALLLYVVQILFILWECFDAQNFADTENPDTKSNKLPSFLWVHAIEFDY